MNPFGLTPGQARALEALIALGSVKAAARELGVSARTLEEQLARAHRKLKGATRLQSVLTWDRWAIESGARE